MNTTYSFARGYYEGRVTNITYWFARGYHDGRGKGVSDDALHELIEDECWQSYTHGYDCGVSDYCTHDLAEVA